MKRKQCLSICAAVMSAALLLGTMPVSAVMRTLQTNIAAEQITEESAVGEAIVMYRGTKKMQTKALSSKMQSPVKVAQSYVFDTSDSANLSSADVNLNRTLRDGGFTVSLVQSDTLSTEQLIDKLQKQSGVIYAEPNIKIQAMAYEDDPLAAYQWALENTGQNGGTPGLSIHADTPELTPDPDAGEQVVAVVDSGVDYTHPDLVDHMWENPLAEKGILMGQHGYDFVNMDDDPMDDFGHGTHCAGIIAASTGNQVGIAGAAASDNIKIMALKFLDEEGYSFGMEIVAAYNYIYQAQQNGVNIVAINNSWGGSGGGEDDRILATLIDLVGESGAVSICAAGNESVDNDVVDAMPANIDSPYVISVAASDERDQLADFSNWGAESVDLAAPGYNILSTINEGVVNPIYWSKEQKEKLLSYYEDFSTSKTLKEIVPADVPALESAGELAYTLEKNGDAEVSVSQDTTDFIGTADEGAASLHIAIHGAAAGDSYRLYLPVTAQLGEGNAYASAAFQFTIPELGLDDSADIFEQLEKLPTFDLSYHDTNDEETQQSVAGRFMDGDYGFWSSVYTEVSTTSDSTSHQFCLEISCAAEGDYEFQLDELAITSVDAPEEEIFQKYDYMSGTSMATPYVVGAMAAIAAANPSMDATERMSLLLGCTRKSDALTGMVKTGGVLDLSYLSHPNPIVTDVFFNAEDATLVIQGNQLSDAGVTLNDAAATVVSNDGKEIVVDVSGYQKQQIDLSITMGENSYQKSLYYAAGEWPDKVIPTTTTVMNGVAGSLIYLNDNLYYMTTNGQVCQYDLNSDMEEWYTNSEQFPVEKLVSDIETSEGVVCNSTKFVNVGDYIYTILHMDYGYMMKNILIRYDDMEMQWQIESELPAEYQCYDSSAIAYYDGGIYMIGGMNLVTENAVTDVIRYDMESGAWEKSISLPEACSFGDANAIGDRLVLTSQQTESGDVPAPWVFDGQKWQTEETVTLPVAQLSEDVFAPYWNSSTAVYENQLLYVGLPAIGLGDIFSYDPVENELTEGTMSVYSCSKDGCFASVVADDVLYVIYNTEYGTEIALYALNGSLPSNDLEKGDVNCDSVVELSDAYEVLMYSSYHSLGQDDYTFTGGEDPETEAMVFRAADVDNDGEITLQDAYCILMYSSFQSLGQPKTWEEIIDG